MQQQNLAAKETDGTASWPHAHIQAPCQHLCHLLLAVAGPTNKQSNHAHTPWGTAIHLHVQLSKFLLRIAVQRVNAACSSGSTQWALDDILFWHVMHPVRYACHPKAHAWHGMQATAKDKNSREMPCVSTNADSTSQKLDFVSYAAMHLQKAQGL